MSADSGEGRVLGIGGLFLRSADPAALTAWYRDMLGVGAPKGEWVWNTAAGPTVFAPFAADSDYFATDRQFMLNLRVSGLDALVAKLEASGVVVERRPEWDSPEAGRFARISDPEGRPIELWEEPAE